MEKITVKQGVRAYKVLKELKVNSMSDDAMLAVWKDLKALRPIADGYDTDVKEVVDTINDDRHQKMCEELPKYQQIEQQAISGEYTLTDEDKAKLQELTEYFLSYKQNADKYLKTLENKEVGVEINKISDTELLKALKSTELSMSIMEELEWLLN